MTASTSRPLVLYDGVSLARLPPDLPPARPVDVGKDRVTVGGGVDSGDDHAVGPRQRCGVDVGATEDVDLPAMPGREVERRLDRARDLDVVGAPVRLPSHD